jgi:hypothetical protein
VPFQRFDKVCLKNWFVIKKICLQARSALDNGSADGQIIGEQASDTEFLPAFLFNIFEKVIKSLDLSMPL